MTEEETVIQKISKLLAKAESTTPEEADALTAKATELMMRHSIDQAVIAARRAGQGKPEVIVEKRISVGGTYFKPHQFLGCNIAKGMGLKVFIANHSYEAGMKASFTWIGFESDVEKAELLYTSLLIQASSAAQKWSKDWNAAHSYVSAMEKFKARRDFLIGFGEAIQVRLMKQRKDATKVAEAENTGTTSVALALVNREDAVKEYFDEKHGRFMRKTTSRMSGSFSGGRGSGRDAGMKASLGGTAVGGSQKAIGR